MLATVQTADVLPQLGTPCSTAQAAPGSERQQGFFVSVNFECSSNCPHRGRSLREYVEGISAVEYSTAPVQDRLGISRPHPMRQDLLANPPPSDPSARVQRSFSESVNISPLISLPIYSLPVSSSSSSSTYLSSSSSATAAPLPQPATSRRSARVARPSVRLQDYVVGSVIPRKVNRVESPLLPVPSEDIHAAARLVNPEQQVLPTVTRASLAEIHVRCPLNMEHMSSQAWDTLDANLRYTLLDAKVYEQISDELDGGVDVLTSLIYTTALPFSAAPFRPPARSRPVQSHQSAEEQTIRAHIHSARRELQAAKALGMSRDETRSLSADLRTLLRLLSKSTRIAQARLDAKQRTRADKQYRKNPWAFVQKLGKPRPLDPTFSEDDCLTHLQSVVTDPRRAEPFITPDWAPSAPVPSVPYALFPITSHSIRSYLQKRPNRSKPGPDGIPYIVWKCCACLIPYLKLIFRAQQRLETTALSCGEGVVGLVHKDPQSSTADPRNFRRICLSNTVGKIFMGMLAGSLCCWATSSGVIDTSIQKGFMPGISGCLEHSAHVAAALRHARLHERQIVVFFLDLETAYGNISHGLLQWACHRLGLPVSVCRLINQYYASLRICVRMPTFVTAALTQEIGLFEGCTLSPILYTIAANLIAECLQMASLRKEAYSFSPSSHQLLAALLADDATGVSLSPAGAQRILDWYEKTIIFLRMRAKPSKCRVMAFKKFRLAGASVDHPTGYRPFNPQIRIAGVEIPCVDESAGFKLLGRRLYCTLSLQEPERILEQNVKDRIAALDASQLSDVLRVHALRMCLPSLVQWDFSVYPFSLTFVQRELERVVNAAVKRWLHLPPSATLDPVYLLTKLHGLNFPSVVTLYKQCQSAACYTLSTSSDDNVRTFYELQTGASTGNSSRWTGVRSVQLYLESAQPEQALSRAGIRGWIRDCADETRWAHLQTLIVQGRALRSLEEAGADNRAWMDILLGLPPYLLKFRLKALLDVLPTSANLFRWGKRSHARCSVCGRYESISHILSNCQPCLSKYAWRHNSVLQSRLWTFVSRKKSNHVRYGRILEHMRTRWAGQYPPTYC